MGPPAGNANLRYSPPVCQLRGAASSQFAKLASWIAHLLASWLSKIMTENGKPRQLVHLHPDIFCNNLHVQKDRKIQKLSHKVAILESQVAKNELTQKKWARIKQDCEEILQLRNKMHQEEIQKIRKICPQCPVCLEKMREVRIFSCQNGCIICFKCLEKMKSNNFKSCSTCRSKSGYVVRALALETVIEKMFEQ